MKVSINWLKEFVDIDLPVDELVKKIGAQLGAVEEVVDLSKKYQGIVVAKVITCEKHPNADKLSLCKIDDGKAVKDVERDKDGLVQVVCGAPNVRAGMLVAWLPPGSSVPASYDKEPFVLEARELRGKVSNGMLASASELALSDDHSGIVELSFGEPGEDFAKLTGLDDQIIDIENKMFTHRPDCFGILGVAREIAGITGKQFQTPVWYTEPENVTEDSSLELSIENSITSLVPRFTARVIEGVDVKASPVWMQSYLTRAGIRPINNIVDITNYVMVLTGQPLHAYDYDKLCKIAKTDTAHLEARLSKKGDKLTLLNGRKITFDDTDTVLITSNDVPVGVGGVMGGADTEVDENTKNIVLECANFDMYSIRRTSMRHGLFTDAVTRFNKGQSPHVNLAILQKTTGWVDTLAGGKAGKAHDKHGKLQRPIAVHVEADFVNSRLGLRLTKQQMVQLLKNVEFEVRINGPHLAVTPPLWRTDIQIAEDIVEEIGRLHGFDNLPLELPKRSIEPVPDNQTLSLKQTIRRTLSAAGANELYLYSFVHGDLLDTAGQDTKKAYRLSNAISPELQYYRLSLTPSLLDKIHANIKAGYEELVMYEIGKTHNKDHPDPSEKNLPKELQKIALVVATDDKQKNIGAGYFHARRYLDYLAEKLQITLTYQPLSKDPSYQTAKPFDYTRSAEVSIAGTNIVIGIIGEYKPHIRRKLKLPKYCAGFELSIEKILDTHTSTQSNYRQLSKFPSVSQDISLRSEADIPFSVLDTTIREALADIPEEFTVVPLDIYHPDDMYKHTTFRITFTSQERTLTDAHVSGLLDTIDKYVAKKLKTTRV